LVLLGIGSVATVLVVMGVAAYRPLPALAGLGGLAVVAIVVARPVRAAYLYLGVTPLVAGLSRGSFVPHLRPSELLLAVLLAAVGLRFLVDALGGRRPVGIGDRRWTDLDRSILAMAVLSSFVPLAWRAARGYRPLLDDLLFATTMWKYLLVFLLFRVVVTDPDQVRTSVKIMLGAGFVVGAIAIAQAVNTPGVPAVLAAVQEEPLRAVTNNRGSSTLGTSHGVADVMAFSLALCLAFWWLRVGPRWLAGLGAAFFGLACLASGQFSAGVALIVVAVVFGSLAGRLWRTLAVAVPATALSALLLWPVVQARLAAAGESGVPSSWEARRFNLTNYFWPELARNGNWLLGVRPAGRLPSYEPWREWVYIESGYTWLLWTGGIPLLVAYLWLSWAVWRGALGLARPAVLARRLAPGRPDPRPEGERFASAIGMAVAVSWAVVFVLMLFDVHLTLRGPADALFPLLALLAVPSVWNDGGVHRSALVTGPLLERRRDRS
jgi:hypothetical protein